MQFIRRMPLRQLAVLALTVAPAVVFLTTWNPGRSAPQAGAKAPDGWITAAVRDEIRPEFAYDPRGGPDGKGCFLITADGREGLAGCWKKSLPVTGGKYYRFTASYQAQGVAVPRRSVVAELHWLDAKGKSVPLDEPAVTGYLRGATAMAETEFPMTQGTGSDGWTAVTDTYQAPSRATQVVVELHLRWAANAEVRWGGVTL